MENIKAPRGVRDILPAESWKWAYIFSVTRKIAEDFGYREVHLPIFEQTELFSRGIGETTDVVEKEMYTFSDRSGRSLTLRPEATASMVRAYLEHSMSTGTQPAKLWCAGPMMRYERPQKGRYRQFWQLDFEAIGSASPLVDVEVIALSLEIFRRLGLSNLEVLVNSVGCPACRPVYRAALQEYLGKHFESLCPTCQGRFDRNPLRILDCKVESCRAITDGAPDVRDHLCGECRDHFDEVLKGLDLVGAKFRIDKRLVRGLDYYTKTAYEVLSGDLGAQNAVCGGGRYDNLAEAIGGPHTPGVGFAAGLDRIVLTMEQQGQSFGEEPVTLVTVVVADENARKESLRLLYELREAGVPAEMDTSGKGVKAQMKAAGAARSAFAAVLGSNEIEKGVVALKKMSTGEQEEIARDRIVAELSSRIGSVVR